MTSIELSLFIVQAISTLIIALTFFFYLRELKTLRAQLDEARRSTMAQSFMSLINFLQQDPVREAREIVIRTLRNRPYETWDVKQLRSASKVCSTYDVASILIKMGLVPVDPVAENWGPSIVACYEICEPHIANLQRPEESGPTYWDDFYWLYMEAKKRLPPSISSYDETALSNDV